MTNIIFELIFKYRKPMEINEWLSKNTEAANSLKDNLSKMAYADYISVMFSSPL